MDAILIHFGIGDLSKEERGNVRQIDDEILLYELHELMPGCEIDDLPKLAAVPDFAKRSFEEVEETFLMMLKEWSGLCIRENGEVL